MSASQEPTQPPVACGKCHTPIRKFIRPGETWHPCTKCQGALCESCCEAGKENKP